MMLSGKARQPLDKLTRKLLRRKNGIESNSDSNILKKKFSPNNELELNWISPVRDSVRVDYNRHVNVVQVRWDQRDVHTRVRD
jgi:hypothetical protein